jgi:Ssp1 endopeptidase immunity protein Rap1a
MKAALAAVAMLVLCATPSEGADAPLPPLLNANVLFAECTSNPTANAEYEDGWCAGYIAGMSIGLFIADPPPQFCIPGGVTPKQQVDVVVQYLRANPKTRNQGSPTVIARALREAWPYPCPD